MPKPAARRTPSLEQRGLATRFSQCDSIHNNDLRGVRRPLWRGKAKHQPIPLQKRVIVTISLRTPLPH